MGITHQHLCHAIDCLVPVPPRMLMCRRHWSMVSRINQREVWRTYTDGQERRKDPSHEYLIAAHVAICEVAVLEGRRTVEATQRSIISMKEMLGVA